MRPPRRFQALVLQVGFWTALKLFCQCTLTTPTSTSAPSNFVLTGGTDAYVNCNQHNNISCVGVGEENCIGNQDCDIFLTYRTDSNLTGLGKRVYFQVIMKNQILGTQLNRYVATGISEDRRMGDDIVVSCIRYDDPSNPLSTYLSFNTPDIKFNEYKNISQTELISDEIVELNGKTYCTFSIPTTIKVGTKTDNLDGTSRYLLIAVGSSKSTQELAHHQHWYITSESLILGLTTKDGGGRGQQHFISRTEGERKRKLGLVGHSALMIVTFISILPTCTFIARFLKESHFEHRICHRKLWFVVHSSGLTIGICFVILSLIVIGVTAGFFSQNNIKYLCHYYLGVTIVLLYVLQMVLGFFLYVNIIDSYTWLRIAGAYLHFINGKLILVLSLVQIFLAPKFMSSFVRFCSIGSVTLLSWMVIYCCMYAVLTAIMARSDLKEFKSLAMRDSISNRNEDSSTEDSSIGFVNDSLRSNSDGAWDIENAVKRKKSRIDEKPTLSFNLEPVERRKSSAGIRGGKKNSRISKASRASITRKELSSKVAVTGTGTGTDTIGSNSKQNDSKGSAAAPRKKSNFKFSRSKNSSTVEGNRNQRGRLPSDIKKSSIAARSKSNKIDPGVGSRADISTFASDFSNISNDVESNHEEVELSQNLKPSKKPQSRNSISVPVVPKKLQSRNSISVLVVPKQSISVPDAPKKSILSISSRNRPNQRKRSSKRKNQNFVAGVIQIVPRTRELIYDDYPDYDMENFVGTPTAGQFAKKVTSKRMKKDPLRALRKCPMQTYFIREHPKTRTFDRLLIMFFVMSIIMSVTLIYLMSPFQGHGTDHCTPTSWMSSFP